MDKNIQKYRAFVETVRKGGFTKAADVLGCSQSGISRMISDLENEWGVVLLERDRGGATLTPDGERLYAYAYDLCKCYEGIRDRVDEIKGLSEGRIRIGTFSSVATHWLPRIIRRFTQDFPKIEYELVIGDYVEIEQWVRDGTVDLGFIRKHDGLDLEYEFLKRDELMAVVPEGHRLASNDTIKLSDLAKEPFMLLEKKANDEVSEIFRNHGLEPDVRFTAWDDYAIMSMIENGLGVGILPDLILRRISYKVEIRHLDVPAYRDICVIMRDRKRLPPAADKFLGYLQYRE